MPEDREPGKSYAVHASGMVMTALRRVQRQAETEGRGKQVLVALRRIDEGLRRDPIAFGEPLYRLPGLRLQICTCVVRPLVIDYAVYEDRPIVFIKGVKLLGEPR